MLQGFFSGTNLPSELVGFVRLEPCHELKDEVMHRCHLGTSLPREERVSGCTPPCTSIACSAQQHSTGPESTTGKKWTANAQYRCASKWLHLNHKACSFPL